MQGETRLESRGMREKDVKKEHKRKDREGKGSKNGIA